MKISYTSVACKFFSIRGSIIEVILSGRKATMYSPELSFRTIETPVPELVTLLALVAPAEFRDALSLFADLSDISLGGPVTEVTDIFSSSNSIGPENMTL